MRTSKITAAILAMLAMSASAVGQTKAPITGAKMSPATMKAMEGEAEFRSLYKELIEINTVLDVGSCTQAAQAMKARLSAAGFPDSDLHLIVPPDRPNDGNLVAILPGTDKKQKAILLLAHIDVVEAKREDWVRDPFKLTEEGGYFYARGAMDDKAMAAIVTDSMARYKKEGYRPRRTLKLALTCGEENGGDIPNANGVIYLVKNHRELIDAAFALNEGAGGRLDPTNGQYVFNGVQAGEKLYQDYTLEVTNPGGHSSRPVPDNAIYRLSTALMKVQQLDFPVEFNDATRGFFNRMAKIDGGPDAAAMIAAAANGDPASVTQLTKNPSYNAILHTTCVATQLTAGHAPNALPQRAAANVNCRIFPGHTHEEIRKTLEDAIADPAVKVTLRDLPETPSPAPPLTKEILGPIEKLTADMYPGVPVVPTMAAGATDGRFLTPEGILTYGVSGIFADPATTNAHGLNERVGVRQLLEGRAFLHRLTKMYAGGK